jgi:hypothetical protein
MGSCDPAGSGAGLGFWAILKPSSVQAKRFALLESNTATNKIDGDAINERTSPLV